MTYIYEFIIFFSNRLNFLTPLSLYLITPFPYLFFPFLAFLQIIGDFVLQHLLLSVMPGNLLHQKYCEMFLSKTQKKERGEEREIGGRCWGRGRWGRGMGRRGRETVSGVIVLVFFSFKEASDSVWLWL